MLPVSGKRKNKRKKAAAKGKRRRSATVGTHAKAATHAQIARPRVTEYNEITVVPVFLLGKPGRRRDHQAPTTLFSYLAYPA